MIATISRTLLQRLLAQAAASPEREVCGLLLGPASDPTSRLIADAIPAANLAVNPADSFEVDPAVLFAAHRAQRAGGPRVIGHYHSHPNSPARPSPRDAQAATEPGRLWLILGGGTVTLWRAVPGGPVAGAFAPLRLETLAQGGCAP